MSAIPAGCIGCLFCSTSINFMSGKHNYFLHLEKEHLIQTNRNILMAINFLDKGTLEEMVGRFEKTFHVIMKFEKEATKDDKNLVHDVKADNIVILSETESVDDIGLQISDNNNDTIIVDNAQVHVIGERFSKKEKKNPITVGKEFTGHFISEDIQTKDIPELFTDKIKEDPECIFQPAINKQILPKSKLTCSFSCDSCEEKFDSKRLLSKHILMQCDIKSFKCDFCGVNFPLLTLLDKHTSRKHQSVNRKQKIGKKENIAKPSQMFNTFEDITSLEVEGINDNLNMDHDSNPADSDQLIVNSNKNNDILIDENDEVLINSFSCDSCEQNFKSSSQLSKHIMLQCDIKSFVCDICGVKFPLMRLLYKHTSRRHQAVNRKKKLTEKENTANINMDHDGKTDSFPSANPTDKLILNINENNDTLIGSETQLSVINELFSDDNEEVLIKKDLKSSFQPAGIKSGKLTSQSILHKSEMTNSFSCDSCEDDFKSNSQLSKHILMQCDVIKSFNCDFCAVKFPLLSLLNKHISRKHQTINRKRKLENENMRK